MYFQKSSLREAGHVLQLGHHPADVCTSPQRSTKTFTIIHTNGIHLVNLAYCGCTEAGKHGTRVQQLLRRRLFPATTLDPQTACTFSLLKSAQLLSLQSKLSLYDYYICLERLTDATGTADVNVSHRPHHFRVRQVNFSKDRYKVFLRMLRMWRHLRMMKRGGRSYDRTGVNGTSPGELAVQCPACPIPSVNLPPNWKSVKKDSEYASPPFRFTFPNAILSGTSTTRHLVSMLAFGSRGGRFRVMRRIRSWVRGMRILSRGNRTASTSVALPINKRFVLILGTYPQLMCMIIR